MSYTLLVIDVQPYFNAANNRRVIRNCRREIRQAIEDKAGILLIEFLGCGRSNTGIAKMISNYDRAFVIIKGQDDGSSEVVAAIEHFNLPKTKIKVIGVNTNACVQSTVMGLTRLRTNSKLSISVVADACYSVSEDDHIIGLQNLHSVKKVKLINNNLWQKHMNRFKK